MSDDRGLTVALIIGVIGSSTADKTIYALAEEVGRLVAQSGAHLICGGLEGVMEAACKGAAEAGGLTIGVLPGDDPDAANPYVRIPSPPPWGSAAIW